jgi:hypothetical protein
MNASTAGIETIRSRIREISIDAGARRSNGSPLVLLPHDCRRVFASEHLNNNTPVHVIQALLGHASPDTVMIYAKLYPSQLIEEYRRTVRTLLAARMRSRRKVLFRFFEACWPATGAACWLREVTANLPDRSRPARWEIVRIKGALQRAEELSDDVAASNRTGSLKSDNCREH